MEHLTLENTWITSDLHLGHANVIKFDGRPFQSIDEMDETLARNFEEDLSPEDNLIILGDLAWSTQAAIPFLERLPTKNVLYIKGNHERSFDSFKHYFKEVYNLHEIKVEGVKLPIVLCHYPMEEWNRSYHGSWHLHGHRHGNVVDNPKIYKLDMSINLWNYRPVQLKTIKQEFDNRDRDESLNYWRTEYHKHGKNPRGGRPLRDSRGS